jgi:alkanesulfonate monooxygenase SsuD/methylene tetrahydromethanopterin reductase-like flavin-dependent oxidoreductase (luciferase family)
MATLSSAIHTASGLTWPLWKRLVREIEQLNFAGLYMVDALPHALGVYTDSLESMIGLGYLADHTQRVRFGTVVALMAAHDPVLLARQAAALDDLSGGRMVLGLGAGGGQDREHRMFGYTLGDIPTRMARLEEGLEVITRLLRSAEPVSFRGCFYQLEQAMLLPHPQRAGGPPILVGGSGPKRTLPLVARYADIWNPQLLTPEVYHERSALLDDLLRAAGRQPGDVRRTLDLRVFCGRSPAELEQRVSWLRRIVPFLATMPLDTLLETARTQFGVLAGAPDTIVEHLQALAAAGVEEIILEWGALNDIAGLQLIAEQVLPHVQT